MGSNIFDAAQRCPSATADRECDLADGHRDDEYDLDGWLPPATLRLRPAILSLVSYSPISRAGEQRSATKKRDKQTREALQSTEPLFFTVINQG